MSIQSKSLVTIQEVKNLTKVDNGIDDTYFVNNLYLANYTHFIKIFGKDTFDDLYDKQQTSGLTTTEEEFLDIVKYAISFNCLSLTVNDVHYKFKNSGVFVYEDEYQVAVDGNVVNGVKLNMNDKANEWLNAAISFYQDNKSSFPLVVTSKFCDSNGECLEPPKKSLSRGNNWYIPDDDDNLANYS